MFLIDNNVISEALTGLRADAGVQDFWSIELHSALSPLAVLVCVYAAPVEASSVNRQAAAYSPSVQRLAGFQDRTSSQC